MPTKQDIISRVYTAIMHILHESYFNGSSLWPKDGFHHGYMNPGYKLDLIMVGIRIDNKIGSLRFNLYNKKEERVRRQTKHLKFVMDQGIYDRIRFEYEYDHWRYWDENFTILGYLNFTFTIND